MFRTASSVIAGRICVWLAAAMLVFPFVPTSSCPCSTESPTGQCCRARLQQEKPATLSCCAKSNQTAVPEPNGSCDCGPTCNCHLSRHSDPRPAVPTAPTRNGAEQVQLATFTHAATVASAAGADSPFAAESSGEPFFETALDRCITLSRFLC